MDILPQFSLHSAEGQANYFATLVWEQEQQDALDRISDGLWAAEQFSLWGRMMILGSQDDKITFNRKEGHA